MPEQGSGELDRREILKIAGSAPLVFAPAMASTVEAQSASSIQIRTFPDFVNMLQNPLPTEYILMDDLDASSGTYETFKIGDSEEPFTGTFDGNGYVIKNIEDIIGKSDGLGLFGYNEGIIKDVGIEGADIEGSNSVGVLVGVNKGIVTGSYAKGSVDGETEVGGLVGRNEGEVRESYAQVEVEGDEIVGGLVGRNEDGSTINETYAAGEVTVTANDGQAGGLVGDDHGSVENSYWDVPKADIGEPDFGVSIKRTNSPVGEGDTLEVEADVTNNASSTQSGEVRLTIDGSVEDSARVENLPSGGTGSATLEWSASSGSKDFTACVQAYLDGKSGKQDEDCQTVTVEERTVYEISTTQSVRNSSNGVSTAFVESIPSGTDLIRVNIVYTDYILNVGSSDESAAGFNLYDGNTKISYRRRWEGTGTGGDNKDGSNITVVDDTVPSSGIYEFDADGGGYSLEIQGGNGEIKVSPP